MAVTFHEQFVGLFEAHYRRMFRYLDRLTGDGELAADLAQEAFVRLYERGSMPDTPGSWLISVALNLLRNESTTRRRRLRLLTASRGEQVYGDAALAADQQLMSNEISHHVRKAIDTMSERDRHLLLLRAEGYSYREMAVALDLNEASIGVLLARAKHAFRQTYENPSDASH
jgi:RNA polymerase sigma-70 factor (ECF subfamily)